MSNKTYILQKMSVLENPSNGLTEDGIDENNLKIDQEYKKMGLIEGGSYLVPVGMSCRGRLEEEPKIGERLLISRGFGYIHTTEIQKIEQISPKVRLLTTQNSTYRLEEV